MGKGNLIYRQTAPRIRRREKHLSRRVAFFSYTLDINAPHKATAAAHGEEKGCRTVLPKSHKYIPARIGRNFFETVQVSERRCLASFPGLPETVRRWQKPTFHFLNRQAVFFFQPSKWVKRGGKQTGMIGVYLYPEPCCFGGK